MQLRDASRRNPFILRPLQSASRRPNMKPDAHLLVLAAVLLSGAGCRSAQPGPAADQSANVDASRQSPFTAPEPPPASATTPTADHRHDTYRIAWHPRLPVLATSCGIVGVDADTRILRPWRAKPPGLTGTTIFGWCDWTPDGSHLIASRFAGTGRDAGRWELVSIDVETCAVRSLFDQQGQQDNINPRCSPHGDVVAFVSRRPYFGTPEETRCRLALLSLRGGHLRFLTGERGTNLEGAEVVWAPSGSHLVVYWFGLDPPEMIALPGGEAHPLADPTPSMGWPCGWRSDDTLLWSTFYDDEATRLGLFAYKWQPRATRLLLQARERHGQIGWPAASPRGGDVVCEVTPDKEPDRLMRYTIGSGYRTVLLSLPRGGSKGTWRLLGTPSWSPDGLQIAYWLSKGSGASPHELWVVRRDGTHNRRVFP